MSIIGNTRRLNLQRLIDEQFEGVVQRLAKQVGIQHSQLWRVLKDDQSGIEPRYVGEKLARKIENSVGLHEGWLDQSISEQDFNSALALAERIDALDDADRAAVLRMVAALASPVID